MCGIVGALTFKQSSFWITEQYLEKMRDVMSHRGPDGAGFWISEDGKVGLGQRRLSIIDLSEAAAQPMCNEDGSIWISLNGEIYNHAEIRTELEQRGGHRWKTSHSDTEVILHAFEEWGIDCLEKFRGMFAFALWDGRKRELWLVRDRIGIKPLYYSFHHGRVTFASEIKALLQDPEQKRSVDEEALFYYLSFLITPAPQTLFAGIKKLPCGTWMRIDESGSVREQRYWDVWDHTEPLTGASEEEICEALLEELRRATNLRKVSDVPVGVFLSGGLDSSTNAALFSEGESEPVKTFTIGYKGEYDTYRNELNYARLMADKVGAEHYECLIGVDDLIDFVPRMVYLQDEPIADPVCVPTYYLSKLARDNGVIVCQVGEGADELFWGYPSWKTAQRLERYNSLPVPRFVKGAGLWGLKRLGKQSTCYYEWLRRGHADLPIYWSMEAYTDLQKGDLFSPRLGNRFQGLSAWEAIEPIHKRFREKAWDQSHLNWATYLDLNLRLPELLLMRLDKMTMAVGLEGRVPFLDHKFVELAMSIPSPLKTKGGELKYILKKAVRGLIPDEIIDRPKQGFAVPVFEWFHNRLGPKMSEDLTALCGETDFFNPLEVKRLAAEGRGQKLWYLMNFALWWKEYCR